MWKPDENKDAYSSENGGPTESWWSKTSTPGEHIDTLLTEYLHTTEAGSEGKASAEDQNGSFRARFEHPHSISSHIPPQGPGIEIAMGEGHHTSSWPGQEAYETGGTPDGIDGGSDGLKVLRDHGDDVAREVGDGGCVSQALGHGGQQISRHYSPDAKRDGENEGPGPNLSPLDSINAPPLPTTTASGGSNNPATDRITAGHQLDQTSASASPLLLQGSQVEPELANKPGPPSPSPLDISSPLDPRPNARFRSRPHLSHASSSSSSSSIKPGYLIHGASTSLTSSATAVSTTARRPFSAVQQYRILDERQAKRAPLWRRRVNYTSSLPDTEEMLATARSQAYDISSPSPMTESLRYPAQQDPSYFLNSREQSGPEHGELFPLSPPLSSARSSFLYPNNNVAPHLNGNYNLSTESLASNVEANTISLLSRPHSMPQLQEQMENPYSNNTVARPYLHHSPSHEYLSPENSFEDGTMMKQQAPLSAFSSFNNQVCSMNGSLELENGEDSSSSAQGSSPQAWWSQTANLELAQDGAPMIYPATSAPAASTAAFTSSLPNMSPKRRFNQTPSNENLSQLLMLQQQQQQQQQQPRSPMPEQDRMYAFMNGQQTHSAMPSPPGSPGYYFTPQMPSDGFCSPTNPGGVSFIDPFHNSGHHQPQPHQQYNTFPRRTPLPKSLLGYDAPVQSTPPIPIRTVPSHASHSNGITRSSYLRKTGSLGRSGRIPTMGKNDAKEVSFVNFTPHDATKILSGVAPSGSSKTKARREREAQEKRRKLSEAAAAAVLAAGGDPSAIENIDF
ncbi:hypothetical protein H072_10258 [Dactylellina haptotyla CBS 200.50]|uniref:Developmental regulatory protein wetA n=1 Tax=Dactylellina haptotyla (strain CBS 200.50) TaxID=1284197 RepID=S7ZZG3_DACHA|nr:hypothetical protein H072_10258 [Dactylellina haptotyla CBS 200.50]